MNKTELDIANEVLQGLWGIGDERKNKINKAGYDYNLVQAYVNRIIKTGLPIKEIEINPNEFSGLVVNIIVKERL